MPNLISTVNTQQWLTIVVVPALITVIKLVIAPGAVQDALVALVAALGGQVLISTRTPSAVGGSTKSP